MTRPSEGANQSAFAKATRAKRFIFASIQCIFAVRAKVSPIMQPNAACEFNELGIPVSLWKGRIGPLEADNSHNSYLMRPPQEQALPPPMAQRFRPPQRTEQGRLGSFTQPRHELCCLAQRRAKRFGEIAWNSIALPDETANVGRRLVRFEFLRL